MAPPVRRLLLVRHGLTAWNAEGRWQGTIDIELSDEGRQQADALGRRLARTALVAAFSSGLSRSRETALRAVGGALPVHDEPDLQELSYGAWEGVRDVEVGERWPEARATWWTRPDLIRPGGGESLAELDERAWRGLVSCLARCPPGDSLVVAHGGVNRVLLGRILGLPLARFWSIKQDPTAVNVIEVPDGPPETALADAQVRLLNCTHHLAGGLDGA